MNRSLFLDDASLGVLRIGLRGLLAEVHTFDDGALLRNLDLQDFARLAFAVTGDNLNLDRKSTRLNSSHNNQSRMPSSA